MDGESGWWTTSGNIGLPPLARVIGVGKQHNRISHGMWGVARGDIGVDHKIRLHGCREVVKVWRGLFDSVWLGISGNLRDREGWWIQVPLHRCLIKTDAQYLAGWRIESI